MERCPVCNARYTGKTECHRCKANLDALIEIESDAAAHLQKAIELAKTSDYQQMFTHARRSWSLNRTVASVKVLACAALMTHRFDLAVRLWKDIKR
jgi:hypothetical protein